MINTPLLITALETVRTHLDAARNAAGVAASAGTDGLGNNLDFDEITACVDDMMETLVEESENLADLLDRLTTNDYADDSDDSTDDGGFIRDDKKFGEMMAYRYILAGRVAHYSDPHTASGFGYATSDDDEMLAEFEGNFEGVTGDIVARFGFDSLDATPRPAALAAARAQLAPFGEADPEFEHCAAYIDRMTVGGTADLSPAAFAAVLLNPLSNPDDI